MSNDQLKEFIRREKSINDHSKIYDYVESINKTEDEDISKEKQKLNYEYIYWLEQFTKIYPVFSNNDWAYDSSNLSKEDMKNVNNLTSIFKVIDVYAKENNITTRETRYGLSYYVRCDDIGYKISADCDQVYCQRIDAKESYMDLDEMVKKEIDEENEIYRSKLLAVDNELLNSYNEGVPLDYIEKHIYKTLKKIKKN